MPDHAPNFLAILRELTRHEVDFIVVGGVSAALHGAATMTFDLDVVHSRHPDNVKKVSDALTSLAAFYREHPGKRLRPTLSDIAGPGHHLLMTNAGPLDLLGAVTCGRSYGELLPHTVEMMVEPHLSVQVLDLAMLITLKEELGREKDVASLPVLRQLLKERKDRSG